MTDDLDDLLKRARQHGDSAGSEMEIGDLQDLCWAMWELLTPEQRSAFLLSGAVESLIEVTGGEDDEDDEAV